MANTTYNNLFNVLIGEVNRSLKERRPQTGWVRGSKLLVNFCNLLVRLGVIYTYETKNVNGAFFLKLSLTLSNGLPVMLLFNNYFYPGRSERRFYAFQKRATSLKADYIYLTPYGFLSRGEVLKYKNVSKVFVGYFTAR